MLLPLLLACTTPPPTAPQAPTGKPVVVTSSYPATYLVQRLAQDSVELVNILPPGRDPPSWSPSGELVGQAQGADLIVLSGAGFEGWVATASLNEDRVLDASLGLDLIVLESTLHSHGKDGEHSHAGLDPHAWSDPLIYLQQAQAVHAGLSKLRGTDQGDLDAALESLEGDLRDLDASYKTATAAAQELELSSSHPSFNYMARRYGLKMSAFDFDPERAPLAGAEQLQAWTLWAAGQDTPILIWESTPSADAQAGFPQSTRHFTMDPLEQPGESGRYDYFAQARANLLVLGELGESAPLE